MTPEDARVERIVENAFGGLADWLELLRQHENDRRRRLAAEARAWRDHATRVVMTLLSAVTLLALFLLTRRA
jgi:hypothetical protein